MAGYWCVQSVGAFKVVGKRITVENTQKTVELAVRCGFLVSGKAIAFYEQEVCLREVRFEHDEFQLEDYEAGEELYAVVKGNSFGFLDFGHRVTRVEYLRAEMLLSRLHGMKAEKVEAERQKRNALAAGVRS